MLGPRWGRTHNAGDGRSAFSDGDTTIAAAAAEGVCNRFRDTCTNSTSLPINPLAHIPSFSLCCVRSVKEQGDKKNQRVHLIHRKLLEIVVHVPCIEERLTRCALFCLAFCEWR